MLHLEKIGSLYIGGRDIEIKGQPTVTVLRNQDVAVSVNPNGNHTVEAMYVQYFLPHNYKEICVLVHGGGHTGSIWESTPDGREGWLQHLLKQGFGVYVVDSVERGRSGWCSLPGEWYGKPEQKTHQRMWEAFRLGSQESFKTKTPYPNQQFPIEYFEHFVKYDVPRWDCNSDHSAKALSQLLNKIGPCYIIAHSQGADMALKCCDIAPQWVKKIVLVEPAAFPTIKIEPSRCLDMLILLGDYIELSPLWTSMKKMTIAYIKQLQTSGINCELVSLPKSGIRGNSHLMMMDRNNLDVLKIIVNWFNSCENDKASHILTTL